MTHVAIEFLERLVGDTYWVITAITPDGPVETRTFTKATAAELERWLEAEHGRRNFYFGVNVVDRPHTDKAKKEHITRLNALHVDVDPEKGADLGAERVKILQKLEAYQPAPTVIVDSGGGYQAFWKMRATVPVAGDPVSLELYNRQIEQDLGGDHCHNLDRIMRLPGTVNVPNAKKRARGRLETPTAIHDADWTRLYELTDFVQAPPPETSIERPQQAVEIPANLPDVDVDRLPIEAEWRQLILHGDNPEEPKYGGDRSRATYAVACRLLRAGVDEATIAAVLLGDGFVISEHVRSQPHPERYAARQIARARDAVADPDLEYFNEHYAICNDDGKVVVLKFGERDDRAGDKPIKRKTVTRMSIDAFWNYYRPRTREIPVGDGEVKKIKAADFWLDHPKRRTYSAVAFDPEERCPPDAYNEWHGFAFVPKRGDWSKMKRHIHEVIAAGIDERYEYLLDWMASAVQKPYEPARVAVVLQGEKGTGKSLFATTFGLLFGQHFYQVADAEQVFSRFSGWLRTCVVLFMDEAYWAGSKANEGKLKALITERNIVVERKYVDAASVKNYLHIIMATNDRHAVPTSGDERRFFITEVSPHRKSDAKYFRELLHEIEHGGYEAMLYDLRQRDVRNFNPEKVPRTQTGERHNWDSATGVTSWWSDVLQSGILPNNGVSPWREGGTAWRELYQDYCAHRAQSHEGNYYGSLGDFTRRLRSILPQEPEERRWRGPNDGRHKRGIVLPNAGRCRAHMRTMVMRTQYAPWTLEDESEDADSAPQTPF